MQSKLLTAASLLIALTGASCSSEPQTFPDQPVPAALTDMQAASLAQEYLKQNSLPTTGLIISQERQPNCWWLYYQTAFDVAAKPPSVSYLIRVHDDGTVDPLH